MSDNNDSLFVSVLAEHVTSLNLDNDNVASAVAAAAAITNGDSYFKIRPFIYEDDCETTPHKRSYAKNGNYAIKSNSSDILFEKCVSLECQEKQQQHRRRRRNDDTITYSSMKLIYIHYCKCYNLRNVRRTNVTDKQHMYHHYDHDDDMFDILESNICDNQSKTSVQSFVFIIRHVFHDVCYGNDGEKYSCNLIQRGLSQLFFNLHELRKSFYSILQQHFFNNTTNRSNTSDSSSSGIKVVNYIFLPTSVSFNPKDHHHDDKCRQKNTTDDDAESSSSAAATATANYDELSETYKMTFAECFLKFVMVSNNHNNNRYCDWLYEYHTLQKKQSDFLLYSFYDKVLMQSGCLIHLNREITLYRKLHNRRVEDSAMSEELEFRYFFHVIVETNDDISKTSPQIPIRLIDGEDHAMIYYEYNIITKELHKQSDYHDNVNSDVTEHLVMFKTTTLPSATTNSIINIDTISVNQFQAIHKQVKRYVKNHCASAATADANNNNIKKMKYHNIHYIIPHRSSSTTQTIIPTTSNHSRSSMHLCDCCYTVRCCVCKYGEEALKLQSIDNINRSRKRFKTSNHSRSSSSSSQQYSSSSLSSLIFREVDFETDTSSYCYHHSDINISSSSNNDLSRSSSNNAVSASVSTAAAADSSVLKEYLHRYIIADHTYNANKTHQRAASAIINDMIKKLSSYSAAHNKKYRLVQFTNRVILFKQIRHSNKFVCMNTDNVQQQCAGDIGYISFTEYLLKFNRNHYHQHHNSRTNIFSDVLSCVKHIEYVHHVLKNAMSYCCSSSSSSIVYSTTSSNNTTTDTKDEILSSIYKQHISLRRERALQYMRTNYKASLIPPQPDLKEDDTYCCNDTITAAEAVNHSRKQLHYSFIKCNDRNIIVSLDNSQQQQQTQHVLTLNKKRKRRTNDDFHHPILVKMN